MFFGISKKTPKTRISMRVSSDAQYPEPLSPEAETDEGEGEFPVVTSNPEVTWGHMWVTPHPMWVWSRTTPTWDVG